MARWLTEWAPTSPARTPGAVPTRDVLPRAGVGGLRRGARWRPGRGSFKVHVQVGGFDPRDPLLDAGLGAARRGRRAGGGALRARPDRRGAHTGPGPFGEVLAAHPRLTAVIAHGGMPEYGEPSTSLAALPERAPGHHDGRHAVHRARSRRCRPTGCRGWRDLGDRVVLGSDFPNIPYPYAEQLAALASWAAADDRLGDPFLRSVLHDAPGPPARPARERGLTTYNRLVVCWCRDRGRTRTGRTPCSTRSPTGPGATSCAACWPGSTRSPTLAAKYDMSFAAVQKHVAVLEKAGLLTKRRSGREQLASGDVEAVRSVASMLTELEQVWRGRIARIDELIASDPEPRRTEPCPSPTSSRTSTT